MSLSLVFPCRRRRWSRAIVALWLIAGMLGAVRSAAAQSADAEALFVEAERLEVAGRTEEAREAFEASNRVEPRAYFPQVRQLTVARSGAGKVVDNFLGWGDACAGAGTSPTCNLTADQVHHVTAAFSP